MSRSEFEISKSFHFSFLFFFVTEMRECDKWNSFREREMIFHLLGCFQWNWKGEIELLWKSEKLISQISWFSEKLIFGRFYAFWLFQRFFLRNFLLNKFYADFYILEEVETYHSSYNLSQVHNDGVRRVYGSTKGEKLQ